MITVRGDGFNVSSTAVLQLTNNSLQVQATASPVSRTYVTVILATVAIDPQAVANNRRAEFLQK